MISKKLFAWASIIPDIMKVHTQTLLHTLGSACIIFATMSNQKVFKNRKAKFLRGIGKISFPLSLVHTLVICSLSNYVYIKFAAHGTSNTKNLIIVFIVTATTSIALAIPLSRFDDWWVKLVNTITRKLLKEKQLVQ